MSVANDDMDAKRRKTDADISSDVKRVWCVRHGQAEHNVGFKEEEQACKAEGRPWNVLKSKALQIRDPALTPLGQKQAGIASTDAVISSAALAQPGHEARAELVVASPLRRTMQTALGLCKAAAARAPNPSDASMMILAHPDLQECNAFPCDTGRSRKELQEEFNEGVDFGLLASCEDTWFEKPAIVTADEDGNETPDPVGQAALQARCARFTAWLAARPEKRIVVVAHHTFFAHLLGIDFLNCEVIEMQLNGGTAPSWEVVRGSADVVPIYRADGTRPTFLGSPSLSGTLAACLTKYGKEAAQETAKRSGLPDPVAEAPVGPAVPATT